METSFYPPKNSGWFHWVYLFWHFFLVFQYIRILYFRWYCWTLQWFFTCQWICYWSSSAKWPENSYCLSGWLFRINWSRSNIFHCQAYKWCNFQAFKEVNHTQFMFRHRPKIRIKFRFFLSLTLCIIWIKYLVKCE